MISFCKIITQYVQKKFSLGGRYDVICTGLLLGVNGYKTKEEKEEEGGLELDFLIRYRGECCPVECKARTGNAKSLQTVMKNPDHYHVCHAIKLGDYNVGMKGQVLTLPFYMAFLLTEV